jgi:hypothetical protein
MQAYLAAGNGGVGMMMHRTTVVLMADTTEHERSDAIYELVHQ